MDISVLFILTLGVLSQMRPVRASNESSTKIADYTWTQELPSNEALDYEKWNSVIQTVSHAMQGTIGISTLLTNGFTLYCLIRYDFIHTRTNVYILSLCVSDLLAGLFMCSTAIMNQFFRYYAEAVIPCVASVVLLFVTSMISGLSLTASTLEKYVYVAHPYTHIRYEDSKIHVIIVITAIWILPIALCVSVLPLNNIWSPPKECLILEVIQTWKCIVFGAPILLGTLVCLWVCMNILLIVRRQRQAIAALKLRTTIASKPSDVIQLQYICIAKPSNLNSPASGTRPKRNPTAGTSDPLSLDHGTLDSPMTGQSVRPSPDNGVCNSPIAGLPDPTIPHNDVCNSSTGLPDTLSADIGVCSPSSSLETLGIGRDRAAGGEDSNYDPQKKQRKRIRMMFAIVLIALITWTPTAIVFIVRAVIERPENLVYSVFAEFALVMLFLNSFINPLVYQRLSPDMERAHLRAMCWRGRRKWY